MKIENILLCGVGGQGTVLASKLLAYCAMRDGHEAKTAETIGMAQRGGSVVSHVRIGENKHSPLIPKGCADIIIAFEPAEAVRCISYLKKGGAVVVNTNAVMPVTASLSGTDYNSQTMLEYLENNVEKLYKVDGNEICKRCGSSKILNVALLAAAAKNGCLGMSTDDLKTAVSEFVPEKFRELNLKAIDA